MQARSGLARTSRERYVYTPRRPEETVLYKVVAENLETFLARAELRDRHVPRFVARELRAFLECGILARGFLRVHCDACGRDRLVGFSCKGRADCPSCGAWPIPQPISSIASCPARPCASGC